MPEEAAAGIWRLGKDFVNSYAIVEGGSVTAIDAGIRPHWRGMVTFLRTQGLGLTALEAVVLTHAHIDHVGFAEQARRSAGSRVFIHRSEQAAVRRHATALAPRSSDTRSWLRMVWSLWKMGALPYPRIAAAASFKDGEVLDIPGNPRVIHVPGHTTGSCALLVASRAALMSGDALVTIPAGEGVVRAVLSPASFNADNQLALSSLRNLTGIEATAILPGHGAPFRDGVAQALETARTMGVWSIPSKIKHR